MSGTDNDSENKNSSLRDDSIIKLDEYKAKRNAGAEDKKNIDDDDYGFVAEPIMPNARSSSTASEPILNVPPVTQFLVLLMVVIYCVQAFVPEGWQAWIFMNLSLVPARFSGAEAMSIWTPLTPITHMFLHGGWIHLIMNVTMALAFGAGLEKAVGAKRYLWIFFISGLAGAVAQFALDPFSPAGMVGASGAISGLFGAILIVMQRAGALGPGVSIKPFIVIWIVLSVVMGFWGAPDSMGGYKNIAWAAHLGGFLAGLLMMYGRDKKKN